MRELKPNVAHEYTNTSVHVSHHRIYTASLTRSKVDDDGLVSVYLMLV